MKAVVNTCCRANPFTFTINWNELPYGKFAKFGKTYFNPHPKFAVNKDHDYVLINTTNLCKFFHKYARVKISFLVKISQICALHKLGNIYQNKHSAEFRSVLQYFCFSVKWWIHFKAKRHFRTERKKELNITVTKFTCYVIFSKGKCWHLVKVGLFT